MKFTKAFFKRPWIIIATCIALTGIFGFFIKNLGIDNSIRQFLPQKDASYTRLVNTEEEFGSMIVIGVSLEANRGSILTPENIEVVRKITDRALEIDQVDEIDSLTHIDYVCDSDGSISASQLIPDTYTGSDEDIMQLKSRLSEWSDMYNRVIINDDNTATQMQITVHSPSEDEKAEKMSRLAEVKAALKNAKELSTEEKADLKAELLTLKETDAERQQKVLSKIRQIVIEETENHDLHYEIFGDPVVAESARSFMISDLIFLIPLVILVVLLSLFFSFKTLDGTLLPLITVVMATVWTMGIMAALGITFTIVSSVIPVALIAVGSAYGIHVLTHYYVALDNGKGELTKEAYENAVFAGLKEVMTAVVLAGITTIVGFISLVSSPIEPLHSFAIFTAVGVGISLLLSITFIPALLLQKSINTVIKQREKKKIINEKIQRRIERARQIAGGKLSEEASGNTFYSIYHFFCGSKERLILFTIALVAISCVGLRQLKIDTALINYFPKDCDMRKGIDYVDKQFAGTNSVYFNIEGQKPGDITNPELLKAVDDMQDYLAENYDGIGKIVSLTTFIKRINQVWHVPGYSLNNTAGGAGQEASDDGFTSAFESDFGDFGDFGDSSFDDFGDFGDDFADSSDSQDSSAEPEEDYSPVMPENWVDPDTVYTARLSEKMDLASVLDMLNQAYVAAGGKTATTEKMMKVLDNMFNYNGMAFYEIPYDYTKYPVSSRQQLRGVVNGYLTLLSGSLGRFVDDDMNPRVMRITCQLRNHSTEETGNIIQAAKDYAKKNFPEGYTIEATGAGEMEYTMTDMIVKSQVQSLLISLICVFVIIAVSFRSAWAGIVGAIPLALAILLNYMVMGFSGINLDLVTSIIASVAVGVGIDYTIHFLTTYKEERSRCENLEVVTRETFKKSGHGIVTNALAVGLGFLVLCFSKFVVLRYIGILVAIVMFTSSFLAMTIIPGILNVFEPRFIYKNAKIASSSKEETENK
ncbi:MAG: MMPL family transporter [Treponema sp.]|nr:MMPL family transporter [Treponema sp.]